MIHIALVDFGVGNLHSLGKALERGGARVEVVDDLGTALDAEALVLPGVGAFGPAAQRLGEARQALRGALQAGMPCLGICLGMQLLFEDSEEADGAGIGLFPGRVRRLRAEPVPQMGWNDIVPQEDQVDPLLAGAAPAVVYYANSFVAPAPAAGRVLAWTRYGEDRFPAVVRHGRVWATQFHPEKSGDPGLRIIRNFIALASREAAGDNDDSREDSP